MTYDVQRFLDIIMAKNFAFLLYSLKNPDTTKMLISKIGIQNSKKMPFC